MEFTNSSFSDDFSSFALIAISVDRFEILDCNLFACQLYGAGNHQLKGLSYLDLLIDAKDRQSIDQFLKGDVSMKPLRQTHRKLDGSSIAIQVGMSRGRLEGKSVLCMMIQDASEIEKTERDLLESNDRFQAVADYTYDWESWLDLSGQLVWVNPAVERLTQYPVSDCMGMSQYPIPMISPEFRRKFKSILARAKNGESGNDVEFQIVTRTGKLKWLAVSWQPIYDTRGKQLGVRMSMRDIEDRKAMEEQLRLYANHLEKLVEERSQRILELEQKRSRIERLASLGQLAASVAHEISNPLAGVKNAIQLLRETGPADADSQDLLRLIDLEINRMTKVLRQMHQLYRPTTDEPKQVDLAMSFHDIRRLTQPECQKYGVALKLVIPAKPVILNLPEIEFRQILHNLVLNAIEASPPGSEVVLKLHREKGFMAIVEVQDSGPGIDSPDLPHIFEPFYTTKTDPGRAGSGLGLAISQSLVQAIGGTIDLQTKPGQGSSFFLRFPRHVSQPSKMKSTVRLAKEEI